MMMWYNTTTPKPTPQDIAFMTGDDVKDVISWLSEGQDERRHAYPPREVYYEAYRGKSVELLLRTCTCGIQYWYNPGNGEHSHNCNIKTIWRM
jgi:hypothetical protein